MDILSTNMDETTSLVVWMTRVQGRQFLFLTRVWQKCHHTSNRLTGFTWNLCHLHRPAVDHGTGKQHLERTKLQHMVKDMFRDAQIEGNFTNHSLKAINMCDSPVRCRCARARAHKNGGVRACNCTSGLWCRRNPSLVPKYTVWLWS